MVRGMDMKRKLRLLILALLLVTFPAGNAAAIKIKIATLSPEGSVWMEKMRAGAEEIATLTEQRVVFRYYPGGVMGSDAAVLRKIRIGQLHGGALVAGSMATTYRDSQVYALPFAFRSFDEVDFVRREIDPIILKGFEEGGMVTFGLADGGFAYVMSNSPIRTVRELRNKKVWIPDNDSTAVAAVKAFDVTPIPLPLSDVRAGLQTGLIDTITTSPIGALVLQWHTQVKYVMDVPFLYLYGIMAINKRTFDKLSPGDQQVVRTVMGNVFREIGEKNREDNAKALAALKKQGIQFIHPPAESIREWRQIAATLPEKLISDGRLSREMVDRLQSLLKQYRSAN